MLLSGDGDFDTYTKEELFSIGNPPQPVAPPTPVPPPVPPPGTPFISVVLELDFGPEHLAWGLKAADDTYVDYRSTNSFKDIPQAPLQKRSISFPKMCRCCQNMISPCIMSTAAGLEHTQSIWDQ